MNVHENDISIVAGGYSFSGVDHQKLPGMVVAVNDAMLYLERDVDVGVTMDRVWVNHRWLHLKQSASVGLLLARNQALPNVPWRQVDWVHSFRNDREAVLMSVNIGELNGQNSGECALNYAMQVWRPGGTIYLFGFDMCNGHRGHSHWYPPYPWHGGGGSNDMSYAKWVQRFEPIAKQLAKLGAPVVNVSPISKIKAFPRRTAEELGIAL